MSCILYEVTRDHHYGKIAYQLPPQLQIIFLAELGDFLCINELESFVSVSNIDKEVTQSLGVFDFFISIGSSVRDGHGELDYTTREKKGQEKSLKQGYIFHLRVVITLLNYLLTNRLFMLVNGYDREEIRLRPEQQK